MSVLGTLSALRLVPSMVALAAEYEATTTHGRMLGLTDEETGQVVGAWSEHHRSTPWPMDWQRVREALTARAVGQRRRP